MHKKARPEIIQWLDCLFLCKLQTWYSKIKGKTETKDNNPAVSGKNCLCNEQIFCQAKNRYALPDQLPLDWDVIRQEMKK